MAAKVNVRVVCASEPTVSAREPRLRLSAAEPSTPSWHRRIGLWLAAAGLAFATISLIASVVAGELSRQFASADQVGALGGWSFGVDDSRFRDGAAHAWHIPQIAR